MSNPLNPEKTVTPTKRGAPPVTPGRLMERRRRAESMTSPKHRTGSDEDAPYDLNDISYPPTDAELTKYEAVEPQQLPKTFKRSPEDRLFVNRSLRLDKIKWFGFDMDYTLAEYIHPEYDEMIYNFCKERLVEIGYPKSILTLKYEHEFAIRCLFIDIKTGHILKIGKFGEILAGMHGRKSMSKTELLTAYPALQIRSEDIGKRFFPQQTLFSMPECCLYADLIHHLETEEAFQEKGKTYRIDELHCNLELTYSHVHKDVRTSVDWIHQAGVLKKKTLEDIGRYVHRDQAKLSNLLLRLKENGGKIFLLTNSEYYYSKAIMEYLLDGANEKYPCWRDYFDVIITSARKPSFFGEGSTFREVDLSTGKLKLGRQHQQFSPGSKAVYEGGSLKLFSELTGANSNEVLYVGDHIFADIVMSKKAVFWRTVLILPEVAEEVHLLDKAHPLINRLINLNFMKNEIFRGLDVSSTTKDLPDIQALRNHIHSTSAALDALYSRYWGSPFRSGSKQTHFSLQVERFADLYTGTVLNLRSYPLNYAFSPEIQFLPHENAQK